MRDREVNLRRFVERERNALMIYRQRSEVEMGLTAARAQMQQRDGCRANGCYC